MGADANSLDKVTSAGERPVCHLQSARTVCTLRVTFFGNGAQSGWYTPSKAQCICVRPIANKYHEGKMERVLNREFKSA